MLKVLGKFLYGCYFFLLKSIKYPTCEIRTNFIRPGVRIGKHVIIFEGCKIYAPAEIGDYTFINESTRIDPNTKSIGRYCSISHGVKIGMGPHPLSFVSTSPVFYSPSRGYAPVSLYDEFKEKGYTEIGHDVFIACNAVILAGVKVGTGAVVTAGSVVVKDVPPYAVVGGNPAKIIKYRFEPSQIEALLKSQWWQKDPRELMSDPNMMISVQRFLEEGSKL